MFSLVFRLNLYSESPFISFSAYLCNFLDPDQVLQNVWLDLINTLMTFLKGFFENIVNLKKNADD